MFTTLKAAAVGAIASLALAGCGPITFVVGITPGDQTLQQTVVAHDGALTSSKVAIIDVAGMIYNANRPGLLTEGENPLSTFAEKLDVARHDENIKAVILRLNTPGGTVTASDAMYREVQRFKADTKKPVIVLMMDLAASGGYYLACAGDKIVAYPTTVTGSIGVIVQTITVKDGLNRIGIHTDAIISGPNKDVGSPFSTLTPEHRQVLQGLVDDFYQRFTDVVRKNRPNIPADKFAMLTDGRVMSGREAATVGLVDQVGDLYTAWQAAKDLARVKQADLVVFHRPLEYVATPYAATNVPAAGGASGGTGGGGTPMTQINLAQFNFPEGLESLAGTRAGFYYLWEPGVP